MRTPRATLLHLSDLHFGRQVLDRNLLPSLKESIKDIGPDFLVVSGDIANNPRRASMREASKFISELATYCNIRPGRVLTVPGNHDYKIAGNFGLGRFTRIPYEMYFRRGFAGMKWNRRLSTDMKLIFSAL